MSIISISMQVEESWQSVHYLCVHNFTFVFTTLQEANSKRDEHLKAYVHPSVVKMTDEEGCVLEFENDKGEIIMMDSEEWTVLQAEFGLSELREELDRHGFTRNNIGGGAMGFMTNGAEGDQRHYERQSEPGPKQVKKGEGWGYETGHHGGGKNDARLRDIDEGLYGILDSVGSRGRGREVYVHVMKLLGLESEILPGKREDKFFGRKKLKHEKIEETKKQVKRRKERARKKAKRALVV